MEKKEVKQTNKNLFWKPTIGDCGTFCIGKETVDYKTFMTYIYNNTKKPNYKAKIKKAS
jgi:hypothetical protein